MERIAGMEIYRSIAASTIVALMAAHCPSTHQGRAALMMFGQDGRHATRGAEQRRLQRSDAVVRGKAEAGISRAVIAATVAGQFEMPREPTCHLAHAGQVKKLATADMRFRFRGAPPFKAADGATENAGAPGNF